MGLLLKVRDFHNECLLQFKTISFIFSVIIILNSCYNTNVTNCNSSIKLIKFQTDNNSCQYLIIDKSSFGYEISEKDAEIQLINRLKEEAVKSCKTTILSHFQEYQKERTVNNTKNYYYNNLNFLTIDSWAETSVISWKKSLIAKHNFCGELSIIVKPKKKNRNNLIQNNNCVSTNGNLLYNETCWKLKIKNEENFEDLYVKVLKLKKLKCAERVNQNDPKCEILIKSTEKIIANIIDLTETWINQCYNNSYSMIKPCLKCNSYIQNLIEEGLFLSKTKSSLHKKHFCPQFNNVIIKETD